MRGLIDTVLGLVRGCRAPRPVTLEEADVVTTTVEDRLAAASIADGVDRALERGRPTQAARIAERITPHMSASVSLRERLARIRLAAGDAGAALRLIDEDTARRDATARLRLLRAACLARLGRVEQAREDLARWAQRPEAATEARRLVALLEWEAGDEHGATLALLRNLRFIEEPASLELLLLLAVEQGRTERVEVLADRLAECRSQGEGDPATALLARTVLPPAEEHVLATIGPDSASEKEAA